MSKKIISFLLATSMLVSLTSCNNNAKATSSQNNAGSNISIDVSGNGQIPKHEKITIWTLAKDLEQFAKRYTEVSGNEVEVLVIAPADYPTKLNTALGGKSSEADVIVGEPQMLPNFFEAGFFEDLSKDPYNGNSYKDKLVDYISQVGSDEQGVLRALSYQMTPGSIIYRRDLAKEIWGKDDPDFVASKFKDYDTIIASSKEASEKGYVLFPDTGALRRYASGGEPWVKDNKLIINDERNKYFDTAVTLYQENLTAFASEWSAAWYASMSGELPIDVGWTAKEEWDPNAKKTQVVAYSMPTWGALIIRDNAGDNKGKFGVTKGPSSYFEGGTFLGINSYSKKKDAAWEFIKFVTLNEKTSKWWLDASGGDVVSMKSILEANKDFENSAFGGQKTYAFYLEEAKKIDYSTVTKYDDSVKELFGAAIEQVQKKEKTKDEALKNMYSELKTIYPELTTP